MKVLDIIAIALFLVILTATPVVVVSWLVCFYTRRVAIGPAIERANRRFGNASKSLKALLLLIAISFGACFLSVSAAREELLREVNALRASYTISVNGQLAGDPSALQRALREIRWTLGHHSHPTKKLDVEIFDQSHRITLTVARDSEDPEEYWVFLPRYWITSRTDIGRIKTSVFDGY